MSSEEQSPSQAGSQTMAKILLAASLLLAVGLAWAWWRIQSVGNLVVMTDPEGADVLLDGAVVAKTQGRTVLKDLTVGPHTLTVQLKGYQEERVEVHIQGGQTSVESFGLLDASRIPAPLDEKFTVTMPSTAAPAATPAPDAPRMQVTGMGGSAP